MLAEMLESLRGQSSSDWECIVVDDGSSDDSEAVVKSISALDDRIKWYARSREPAGACTCRNIGVEMSRGDYVMFLDSDDLAARWCVAQRLQAASEARDADILVFPAMMFRKQPGDEEYLWNAITSEAELHRFLKLDSPWQGTGPLWRREVFLRMGGWHESLACWQDIDLSIRALAQGLSHVIRYDLPADVYLRRGDGNSVSSSALRSPAKLRSKAEVLRRAFDVASSPRIPGGPRAAARATRVMAFTVIRDHLLGRSIGSALSLWREALARGVFTPVDSMLSLMQVMTLARPVRRVPGVSSIDSAITKRFATPPTIGTTRRALC
jgi:hypothetical protein